MKPSSEEGPIIWSSSATGVAHTPGLGKTTITVRRAAAAAFYLLNPGKTKVLPVLPPTVPLLVIQIQIQAVCRVLGKETSVCDTNSLTL